MNKKVIFVFVATCLFIACRDDVRFGLSDDAIAPLYSPPRSFPLNLEEGYTINPWTGDSILPLTNPMGEAVVTGQAFEVKVDSIHFNDFPIPRKIKPPQISSSSLAANVQIAPTALPSRPADIMTLPKVVVPPVVPIPALGMDIPCLQPPAVKALPFRFKKQANQNFQYLDVEQGISASEIHCLLEDSKGNIWIGTHGSGVSKYNGSHFMHYSLPEGLPDKYVHAIIEDKQGNIWLGTRKGVVRYDGRKFSSFTKKEGLGHNHVQSIFEDKEGNLWFGTLGGGVCKYDGTHFVNYSTEEGLVDQGVFSIIQDQNDHLWFATLKGISIFDGEHFEQLTTANGLSSNLVKTLTLGRDGAVWIGTENGGLNKFDQQSITQYPVNKGLLEYNISSIVENVHGHLWIGTRGGGIVKFDSENFTQYTEQNGLSDKLVSCMIEDQSGNLWIGTEVAGINKFEPYSFVNYTTKEGLSSNRISYLKEDENGRIWMGNKLGGFSILDNNELIHFELDYTTIRGLNPDSVITLEVNFKEIRSIEKDKQGNLWLGTLDNGLIKYDGDQFWYFSVGAGLMSNGIRAIREDDKGNLWFGHTGRHTGMGGLMKYDGDNVCFFSEENGLFTQYIYNILIDHNGHYWFGTHDAGVYKFDGKEFIQYTTKEGLSHNNVYTVFEDSEEHIWIGTDGGGVNKFDGKEFTVYSEKEGLINNRVYSILEDKRGNIWLSTDKGLSCIISQEFDTTDSKTNQKPITYITNFSTSNGLKGLDFTANCALLDSHNRAWWGNGKSLVMLDMNTFNFSPRSPKVNLNRIEINERFIDFHNLEQDSFDFKFQDAEPFANYPNRLRLQYDQNYLSFHFSAIDWNAPQQLKYSFKIEGLNENWSTPSVENKADYRNLPYGTHTFKVRAIGTYNRWSTPFEYQFTIIPPWWQTWWAKVSYLLLLMLTIWGYVKYRTAALKVQQKALEHTIEERTASLKEQKIEAEIQREKAKASEQAKQQFLANMSHEIRTPMNAIKGMTDILIRRNPLPEQVNYLNAIKESSGSLLVIINDILDLSKIEAGKIDLEHVPFSIHEVIQNVETITQFKVSDKGLSLQTNIDEGSVYNVLGDPTRLHQILLNLTSNAIKFTDKGTVTIQLKVEKINENRTLAKFCISDTGVGIENDHLEKIFDSFEQAHSDTTRKFGGTGLGLSISKRLVELQKGKIWAESDIEKGSQFYFTIPFEIAHQTKEETASQDKIGHTTGSLKGVEILLVEDNQFNAIVAREELEDAIENVQVDVAENGAIAVEKVQHNTYDIILMDVQMPVMNGYEATQKIRVLSNEKASIPIIAMTANVMKEEVQRCYEAGMDDFIGKPFDTEDLIAKIQNLLRKKT